MKKNIIVIIFSILVLSFISVSLFGSWYYYNMHMELSDPFGNYDSNSTTDGSQNIYLTKIDSTYQQGNALPNSQSISISDLKKQIENFGNEGLTSGISNFLTTIDNTFIITFVAFIFALIALIFALLNFLKPKIRIFGAILAVLVFIFAIAAPIYFMMGFSGYIGYMSEQIKVTGNTADNYDMGFWYSYSKDGSEISMGPSYSWYLMFIAGIFSLLYGIMLFLKQKQPIQMITPTYPQTPPYNPPN